MFHSKYKLNLLCTYFFLSVAVGYLFFFTDVNRFSGYDSLKLYNNQDTHTAHVTRATPFSIQYLHSFYLYL